MSHIICASCKIKAPAPNSPPRYGFEYRMVRSDRRDDIRFFCSNECFKAFMAKTSANQAELGEKLKEIDVEAKQ